MASERSCHLQGSSITSACASKKGGISNRMHYPSCSAGIVPPVVEKNSTGGSVSRQRIVMTIVMTQSTFSLDTQSRKTVTTNTVQLLRGLVVEGLSGNQPKNSRVKKKGNESSSSWD